MHAEDVDRRHFPRMRLDHPVALEDPTSHERFEGRARSLSGGGLLFETDRRLEAGALLEATLTPPMTVTEPLRALLEVVRCEAEGTGETRFRVAGRFTRLLPGAV